MTGEIDGSDTLTSYLSSGNVWNVLCTTPLPNGCGGRAVLGLFVARYGERVVDEANIDVGAVGGANGVVLLANGRLTRSTRSHVPRNRFSSRRNRV
jgi:hypothetical protein